MSNLGMAKITSDPALQTKPSVLQDHRAWSSGPLGLQISMRATTVQTGGSLNLFEVRCPAGFATPLHIHYAEDVALYILKGQLTLFLGEDSKIAGAGSYFFTPRGTPHGFRVTGAAEARIICISVPGALDRFLHDREFLSEASEPEALAARYKIEILGPLPD